MDMDGGGRGFSAPEKDLQSQTPLFVPVTPPLFFPPVGSKPEEDTTADDGFQCFQTPPKRIKTIETSNPQEEKVQALSELKPLGLTLSRTPSFLDLFEKLSHDTNTNPNMPKPKSYRSQASNFCVSRIQIGTWERVSNFEGELVAKCYFAKKKLVWEFLNEGLKSKIEIQWSDIVAIRATMREREPGILEIEVRQPPTFFEETEPEPKKHTMWHPTSDFTDGQATSCRTQKLTFPAGILDRHYEKLVQSDQRLFHLSRKPFPCIKNPEFSSILFSPGNFTLDFNGCEPGFAHQLQFPLPDTQTTAKWIPPYDVQTYEGTTAMPPLNHNDLSPPVEDLWTDFSHIINQSSCNIGVESPAMMFWPRTNKIVNVLPPNQIQGLPPLPQSPVSSANQANNRVLSCQRDQSFTYGQGVKRVVEANQHIRALQQHLLNDLQVELGASHHRSGLAQHLPSNSHMSDHQAQQLLSNSQEGFPITVLNEAQQTVNVVFGIPEKVRSPCNYTGLQCIEYGQDKTPPDECLIIHNTTEHSSLVPDGRVYTPYLNGFGQVSNELLLM